MQGVRGQPGWPGGGARQEDRAGVPPQPGRQVLNNNNLVSLIYNCKSLLCTESFSGFFAGLLDIPSIMYYRNTNLEVMNQFIPQFSILNSLKIKLDIELTVND